MTERDRKFILYILAAAFFMLGFVAGSFVALMWGEPF